MTDTHVTGTHSVNALGDYLKARRELVQPDEVGIRVTGARRVAGLRREEVAMLAGISSDYYLRLEQGRDRNPSVQVLQALAQVLRLDDAATEYLLSLARDRGRAPARPRREVVPASIRQLLEVIGLPAFVEGRYFDVLASNALAVALSPNLAVGGNRLRALFLDEGERALYPEWDRAAAKMVAGFRASVGTETTDPRVVTLVGELSLASEQFRQLWARHDVRAGEGGLTLLRHPQLGDLSVSREKLTIGGTDRQLLVIYHAAAGSDAEGLLSLLATLAEPGATAEAARAAAAR
jgi:transcriptional regulator with XRE-family HTH domain